MAESLKFVYVLILFISIFNAIIVCDFAFLPNSQNCITDKDCRQVKNYIARCRKGRCVQSVLRWVSFCSSKRIVDYTLWLNIRVVVIVFYVCTKKFIFFFLFPILCTLKLRCWQQNAIRRKIVLFIMCPYLVYLTISTWPKFQIYHVTPRFLILFY